MLDLANLEMESLFAMQSMPGGQIALFAANGTILVLGEGNSGGYKINSVFKLLGLNAVFDDDSL